MVNPRIGFIGFAFGQHRDGTAGVSNREIATRLAVLARSEVLSVPVVVTQWEVALAAEEWRATPGAIAPAIDHIVGQHDDVVQQYLTTKQALDRAMEYLQAHNVERVMLVGHPLHLVVIRTFLRLGVWKLGVTSTGIRIKSVTPKGIHRMSSISYDNTDGNVQWWTRNWWSFGWYLTRAALTRTHGH